MAPPHPLPSQTQNPPLNKRLSFFQCVFVAIIVLAVLFCVALLITWLTMKPKHLIYTIEAASVQDYVLTNDDHLNAKFNYVINSYNPDKHLSVKYHSIGVSIAHRNQSIAYKKVSTFKQPPRNETSINVKLVSNYVALSKQNAKDLRKEKMRGEIEMDVYITARVHYKTGIWRSRKRMLKAACKPVMLNVTANTLNGFVRTFCQTHI